MLSLVVVLQKLGFEVVLEETAQGGAQDSPPMTLSCHRVERPPSVQRGEESDRTGARKRVSLKRVG